MAVVDAVRENWLVLLIPFFSGFVGWITNVAAVWLLFYPLDFMGIRPYLGWQGVIPGASQRMGKYLAKLIATKLLDLREVLAGLDVEAMLPTVRPALHKLADDVVDGTATKHVSSMWNAMDAKVKVQVREAVRKEVEALAKRAFGDLQGTAAEIIDVARTIEIAIAKDKALLNNLFLVAGSEEFKFIKISGLYFGFLFGIPQFIIWCYFPIWWTLPAAGVAVGYVTNWLAMKMIFEPRTPTRYGPFTFQGLFHKRQHEVAVGFSHTVADTMLTPANIVEQISSGEGRKTIQDIFQKRIGEVIEQYKKHPMASMILQQVKPEQIDEIIVQQMDTKLTEEGGLLWTFVERTVDVGSSMSEKLKELDPETFEGVLRPAFQEDEWKLIAVGAVLGGIAGWLQAVYMFGESVIK